MLRGKKGASLISIALCAVAFAFITASIVVAKNNFVANKAQKMEKKVETVENSAYVKVYTLSEVENIARQAFADNYLSYYDGEVDLEGLEALVIGQTMEYVPQNQIEDFRFIVLKDRVNVEKI